VTDSPSLDAQLSEASTDGIFSSAGVQEASTQPLPDDEILSGFDISASGGANAPSQREFQGKAEAPRQKTASPKADERVETGPTPIHARTQDQVERMALFWAARVEAKRAADRADGSIGAAESSYNVEND
jgi:hypothetical protein